MNTPAHLIFGLAAFGRPGAPAVIVAALVGSMIPDLSLYVLAGWHLMIMQVPPEVVFGEMYYSDAWQTVSKAHRCKPRIGPHPGLAVLSLSRRSAKRRNSTSLQTQLRVAPA
jgi:hypothetical protein